MTTTLERSSRYYESRGNKPRARLHTSLAAEERAMGGPRNLDGTLSLEQRRLIPPKIIGLSPRKVEVLRLISQGHTEQEVASLLGISSHTINNHMVSVREMLNTDTSIGAVLRAADLGILDLEQIAGDLDPRQVENLTLRERDVLRELATTGGTNKDLADVLKLSPQTVKNHLIKIVDKLGFQGNRKREKRIKAAILYRVAVKKGLAPATSPQ